MRDDADMTNIVIDGWQLRCKGHSDGIRKIPCDKILGAYDPRCVPNIFYLTNVRRVRMIYDPQPSIVEYEYPRLMPIMTVSQMIREPLYISMKDVYTNRNAFDILVRNVNFGRKEAEIYDELICHEATSGSVRRHEDSNFEEAGPSKRARLEFDTPPNGNYVAIPKKCVSRLSLFKDGEVPKWKCCRRLDFDPVTINLITPENFQRRFSGNIKF